MDTNLVFYLLGKKNGFDMRSNLKLVQESQFWTPEQTEAYQMKHLRRLLAHAYRHVPFYRDAFDRLDFKPSDVRSTTDLCWLKPIRKKDILAHPEAFMADNSADFAKRKHVTGGTTGELLLYGGNLVSAST